ncbi:MAG: hypothetical protein U5M23_04795 [Marinagarivorans sp.]|nr:hypothetical protein [Marinagarivorans sp.]
MKKSTSALFYSAFVFPGAGLFALQQKKRGYLYLAVTVACLAVLIVDAYRKAQIIADRLVADMLKSGNLDAAALTQLITRLPATVAAQMKTLPSIFPAGVITGVTIALVVIWAVGMLESYWQGRKLDAPLKSQ